jgi:hypothetical protein
MRASPAFSLQKTIAADPQRRKVAPPIVDGIVTLRHGPVSPPPV